MPNNKKKGRSAKKGAKDDRKAEKERKKFEARLIYEPCPNGLRCSDPKCRHVHVCPHTLEVATIYSFAEEDRKDIFPGGLDIGTPIEEMSADAQAALVAARHELIQQMIKNGGHDFRCSLCFGPECENILEVEGASRGNTEIREKIDALHCEKCDFTFCPNCIGTCKGCNVQLCYGCDPILEFTFKEDSKDAIGEIFFATEGHCASCTRAIFPKMIQTLDDTKYRDAMCKLYSKFPSCAYCTESLPNGPETKRCGGCRAVRYCGKECQEKDWSGKHREYCEVLRQDRNERLAKWYQKHQPKLEAEAGLWDIE